MICLITLVTGLIFYEFNGGTCLRVYVIYPKSGQTRDNSSGRTYVRKTVVTKLSVGAEEQNKYRSYTSQAILIFSLFFLIIPWMLSVC